MTLAAEPARTLSTHEANRRLAAVTSELGLAEPDLAIAVELIAAGTCERILDHKAAAYRVDGCRTETGKGPAVGVRLSVALARFLVAGDRQRCDAATRSGPQASDAANPVAKMRRDAPHSGE